MEYVRGDSLAKYVQDKKLSVDDTLRLFRRYHDEDNPLPFLLVITWNDHEEGTAIEYGISRCGGQPARRTVNSD